MLAFTCNTTQCTSEVVETMSSRQQVTTWAWGMQQEAAQKVDQQ
jgi:hypothetical protein